MNWIHYLKYELFSVYYFRMSAKCGMIGIFIFFIFSTLVERDSNTGVFLWNLPNCLEHLLWTIPANDCYWISIANCQNTFLRFSTWSVFILLLRDPPNSMTRTCIFVSVSNWNWNSILFYIVYSLLKKLFSIKTRIILKSVKWFCKSIDYFLYDTIIYRTNISPLSIWLSQESFNCNTACQTTRWHQRSNESQRDNISSLYRLFEAFDTIDFSVLIWQMHTLNFSKRFLYWIFSYLTDRRHFVQIDSNISNILYTNFGGTQGSILGPALFNLCVADMKSILHGSKCIQYADNSTIYRSCKIKNIGKCSNEIEGDLNAVEVWSKKTNLIF